MNLEKSERIIFLGFGYDDTNMAIGGGKGTYWTLKNGLPGGADAATFSAG